MKKWCAYLGTLGIAAAASSSLHSQVLFQPRVMVGYLDYEINVESNIDQALGSRVLVSEIFGGEVGSSAATSISETFPALGVGLTAIRGSYFADIYVQDSISASFDDQDSFVGRPIDASSTEIGEGSIDRQDIAISFGRAFDNGFSVSAGYKTGVTEFSQVATLLGEGFTTSYEFDIAGPFAAVSYGRELGAGVIGLNVAVADLSADYNFGLSFFQFDQQSIGLGAAQRNNINGTISGGATGLTLGVSWKAPIPFANIENLTYALSVDNYDYDIDLSGGSRQLVGGGATNGTRIDVAAPVDLSANFNENVTSFRLALQYLF